MDKYEQIEALGSFITYKRGRGIGVSKIIAFTQQRQNHNRVSIKMNTKTAEVVGLERGCYCNLVLLPNGKYCLCRVREHLGFMLTGASKTPGTLYCFIHHVETTSERVEGSIEDDLILFPEGSFNALPVPD